MLERFSSVILCILLLSVWLVPFFVPQVALPFMSIGSMTEEFESGTILFVGDIMPGRHVERLSEEYGAWYSFLNVVHIVSSVDLAVGNFEGTIPKDHSPTPDFNFEFSIDKKFIPILKGVGFDALSLANNHALDYGSEAYVHTQAVCDEHGLSCNGHPYEIVESTAEIFMVGQTRVGVLFLHVPSSAPVNAGALSTLIRKLLNESEMQIVYIHWGTEYELLHERSQELLAHDLVDRGFDAVIGHHPHVVQDIAFYKDKPIFYSLGNFIFDQYFDTEVQKGLGVKLEILKDQIRYTLIPFTSVGTRSQPRIMSVDEKSAFIDELSARSASQEPLIGFSAVR